MTVIRMNDVTKSYRGNLLYAGVDLRLEAGRMYGLTGPNGSGKSALLRMLCGFTRPDAGSVEYDPRLTAHGRTFPDRFGVLIDGPAYIPGMSAERNLLLLARIQNRIGIDEIRSTMEAVGLQPTGRKHARAFSAGMKQKLALCQALMEAPEVLILDEPFTALDADSVERLRGILRQRRDEGVTILVTVHGESEFLEECDHHLEVADRRVVLRR